MSHPKRNVVVVGGGTGTYTLLRGLRQYHDIFSISAIVTMADSGGSTGRLRDTFGQLPVGDVRQALAALSPDIPGSPNLLRELFLYRFQNGEGLSGHNFGNLFLAALTDVLGSEAAAIEAAGILLRIDGRVIPVTTDKVHLAAVYTSGRQVVGEHEIDEPALEYLYDRIATLSLSPAAQLSKEAREVIIDADCIIFGPGDFYTSILANVVVDGFREAVGESQAELIFVANLMARGGQTIGMHIDDYLTEFERYVGQLPHRVLIPQEPLREDLIAYYAAKEGVHPVSFLSTRHQAMLHEAAIVSPVVVKPAAGDVVTRSLIRHDSDALALAIKKLLHSVRE